VAGRGELQLAILIEVMRREGFELTVGRPRVVIKRDENGQLLEPIEEVTIDVDEEYSGVVVQKLSERRAELRDMRASGAGRQRLVFLAPTRGLIGYHGELLTDTRGTGLMYRLFHAYAPHSGEMPARRTGVLISNAEGSAVAYALWNLEDRGPMFIEPGTKVYRGMIVGEHTRGNDLEINVLKGKKLTNMRASGKDDAVLLTPPDQTDAGTRHRLHRRRRDGRGDAEVDPAAKGHPRPARAQEVRAPPGRGGVSPTSLP
jgi:GTP-binding protein